MVRNIIKKIIPKKYQEKLYLLSLCFFDRYYAKSYSQEGEDMILQRFFIGKKGGFYVDIGANNPKRFSNTYFFYKLGWRGINIDAMPGSMKLFDKIRPADINIEAALNDENAELMYYAFSDPALNGFSKELAELYEKEGHKLLFSKKIKTKTLADVLDENLPKGQKIDFLSVDVEGLDLNVLKSNNWEKYVPEMVLVEMLDNDLGKVEEDEVVKFLAQNGYKIKAKSYHTGIFQKV